MPAITERARPSDPVRDLISGAVAEVDDNHTLRDVAAEFGAGSWPSRCRGSTTGGSSRRPSMQSNRLGQVRTSRRSSRWLSRPGARPVRPKRLRLSLDSRWWTV